MFQDFSSNIRRLNIKNSEYKSNHQRYILFLKISQNSQKTPVLKSLFNKIAELQARSATIKKRLNSDVFL